MVYLSKQNSFLLLENHLIAFVTTNMIGLYHGGIPPSTFAYTETKKFRNTSHIRIFIKEIHGLIYTNELWYLFS